MYFCFLIFVPFSLCTYIILFYFQDWDLADADLKEVLRVKPGHPDATTQLGVVAAKRKVCEYICLFTGMLVGWRGCEGEGTTCVVRDTNRECRELLFVGCFVFA